MNSMRLLLLLAFVLYEMQSANSTIKHLKYLKSLLMSKHSPSTTEQPIVEEEVYPLFVQCEPAEGDANVDTPIEWNPQDFLTNEQKPVLIEIENVESVPNIYPGQYYGILPGTSPEVNVGVNSDVNTGLNSGIIYEGNPEADYLKVYEKDLNPEWLASRVKIEEKPETIDIKKGVVSLKDKIREKINLIKSKLKLIHSEPKPVMEIIDQDSPFFSEEDNNNNNNYFQYASGKPVIAVESISTGKPISTMESITTGKPISTMESITTGRPFSTIELSTTGKPFSTTESITTGKPSSTMESSTTGKPFSTTESISTGKPISTLEWITSEKPFSSSTMESITTGNSFSTTESITTGRPFSTMESITTGKPVTSTESVVSTTAAGPVVVIKPILKPFLYAQKNFDRESRVKPFPFALPALPQTLHKVFHYSPLPYENCLPPLTREMCRRRSNAENAPTPWAVTAKPWTLENTPYVVVPGTGNRDDSQNQSPVFDHQQQQQPTVTNQFGSYYWSPDQQQQLTAIGIDRTVEFDPAQRLYYVHSINRPRPSTLENTRYVVVPASSGRPQTQGPVSIDQLAVVNRFENTDDNQQRPVVENGPAAQIEQHQQQQQYTPAIVVDQSPQLPVTKFENTYGGPATVQTSNTPPPPRDLPETGTLVSAPGQPIAVYPNVVATPSSPPVEPSYPENDWTRNLAATSEQEVAAGGPLRGDIPLGSDEYGVAQAAVRYEMQNPSATIERRQTKQDETAVVDKTGSQKHDPALAKIHGPAVAKVSTPVFESIAEKEEKTGATESAA